MDYQSMLNVIASAIANYERTHEGSDIYCDIHLDVKPHLYWNGSNFTEDGA